MAEQPDGVAAIQARVLAELESRRNPSQAFTRLVDYRRAIEFGVLEAYNVAYAPEKATEQLVRVAALAIEAAALCAAGRGKQ